MSKQVSEKLSILMYLRKKACFKLLYSQLYHFDFYQFVLTFEC